MANALQVIRLLLVLSQSLRTATRLQAQRSEKLGSMPAMIMI